METKQVVAGGLALAMLAEVMVCAHHRECAAHPEQEAFAPTWERVQVASTGTVTATPTVIRSLGR